MKTNALIMLVVVLTMHTAHSKEHLQAPPLSNENVTIDWLNPSKYKDVDKNTPKREKEQLKVIAGLGAQLLKVSSKYLHSGMTLELKVTDVDIAGQLEYVQVSGQSRYMRIVREGFPAILAFEYRLLSAQGEVVDSGTEKLIKHVGQINTEMGANKLILSAFKLWIKAKVKTP